MIQRAIVFLSLVATIFSLWLTAAPLIDRHFGQATAMADSPKPQAAPQVQPADLTPVLAFAPFGSAATPQEQDQPSSTDIDLTLLGISLGETPDHSHAMIAGGDGLSSNYAIGDSIVAGAILSAVHADHITLNRDGQEQVLYFQTATPAAFTSGTVIEPAPRVAADSTSPLGRYRAEVLQDAPGLLTRLGLQATDSGYLVTDAATPQILQAGLLPGDLIHDVNGTPLGDPSSDAALFDEVAALGQASLSVDRGGTTLLMTFPLQ